MEVDEAKRCCSRRLYTPRTGARPRTTGLTATRLTMKYRWPAPKPCNANLGIGRVGKPQDVFFCFHIFRIFRAPGAASFEHGLDDFGDVLGGFRDAPNAQKRVI